MDRHTMHAGAAELLQSKLKYSHSKAAKLVSLQYRGDVYSDSLYWTGTEQAVHGQC